MKLFQTTPCVLAGLLCLTLVTAGCNGGKQAGSSSATDGDEHPNAPIQDVECDAPETFVPSPMRRITVEEFDNAVKDLFDEVGGGAELLPADEVTAGYANNSVITLAANQVEKFQLAARAVAERVGKRSAELLPCSKSKEECVADFMNRVGRRAFSRPLEDEERLLFATLYKEKAAKTSHEEGLRLVVELLLQYPSFMYRAVVGEPTEQPGVHKLTPWEMAARLSFYLWQSVPDDELLDAASSGGLSTPSGIKGQAERMMADEKFGRSMRSFSLQWFAVGESVPIRNAEEFPGFNQQVWEDLREGAGRFFAHAVKENGDLQTMMTAPFAFVNKRTAGIFGVSSNAEELEYAETNPRQRGGMMTQASVMATLGSTEVSRPIKRGLFVRNRLFCQDPPPPPPEGVPPFEADTSNLTVRQMLEAHRNKPTCAACHAFFDPIGLAFSNFDGIGQYRETEKGQAIDASGSLSETDVDGSFTSAMEMMNLIKDSKLIESCAANQVMRFALGRLEGPGDQCSVAAVAKKLSSSHSLADFFLVVTTSNAFRFTGS